MSDIHIIGEDHKNVAGITLFRESVKRDGPGKAFMELYAHLNGVIQAFNENKVNRQQLENVLTYNATPETRHRVPQMLEMLEEFKANHTQLIAYDVRWITRTNDPRASFINFYTKKMQAHAQDGASPAELAAERSFIDTVAKHWNESPINSEIEAIVRQSRAQGINNEDVIAARVIQRLNKEDSTHVLAGATHIDGQAIEALAVHGILDDALRVMGNRTQLTIAADHVGELTNGIFVCRTSEKIDNYVIVNPQTQRTEVVYTDNPSLERAIAQAKEEIGKYQNRITTDHYGGCTDDRLPTADKDPEYGPALRRLSQVEGKSNSR